MLMLGQLGLTILVWTSLKARQDKKIEKISLSVSCIEHEFERFKSRLEKDNKYLGKSISNLTESLEDYSEAWCEDIDNARNRISLLESDYTRISNKLKRITPVKTKTNTVNKTQTTKTKKL